MPRPSYLPETRSFSQADPHIVQRPEGLDGGGADGVKPTDPTNGRVDRYAEVQVTPGRFEDGYAYTNQPASSFGGEIILFEKDIGWNANSFLVDNWTNQWLNEPNMRRFIPPYSGGWVIASPKAFQKLRILLKAPSATYTPAAVIAGEFVWFGWHESYLPPNTGIIDRTKAPVVV